MPSHLYYQAIEARLFARLPALREQARKHGLTLRAEGKDAQPKTFSLWRRAKPYERLNYGPRDLRDLAVRSSANSLYETEVYLDALDEQRWCDDV